MAFKKLFSPIRIRGVELRNRVVMAGMGTQLAVPGTSEVSEQLIDYHVARAKGGVGLNIMEVTSVDSASAPRGFLSLSDDKYIPGFRKLCEAVHAAGGKVAPQLWQGALAVSMDPAAEKLSVSDMPFGKGIVLPAISEERILSIIDAYGQAARRAVEAGVDALEFHSAHNYLPHSFLSGGFNHRTDQWGGSLENQMRFPLACIRAIRANMPDDMPLLMRVDCHDDFLENGLTIEDVITYCKRAGELGVDVIDVSRGNIFTAASMYEVPPVDVPHGINVEKAARIRKETGLLVMPAGRINTPELAEEILEKDQADLVIMARAQLADPEFCNKAKAGQLSAIRYCIGCNQGCYDYFVNPEKPHISCTRNPAVGCEAEKALTKAETPKRVLVAGGGIGGIEAATDLKLRGHIPVLCEAGDHLGGQFLLAGKAPRKDDFARAGRIAAQYVQELGVEIRLHTPVTPELIAEEKPDAVILAIGSAPIIPSFIPGADGENVFDSHSVLAGESVPAGKTVIIGGGLVGMEAAEFLSAKGSSVTVVEMKEAVLEELGSLRKIGTRMALAQEDVTILLNTACREIRAGQVLVDSPEGQKVLEADAVVMAIGSKPQPTEALKDVCREQGIPCYVIGDALAAPRLALNAIHEAYDAALSI